MKPFLSLICLSLLASTLTTTAHAAPVSNAAACQATAEAAVKRTAAYRYGSVREKQALLRGQAVAAYVRVCLAKKG